MRIARQTRSKLVVKTNERWLLRSLAWLALIVGVTIIALFGVHQPGLDELQTPTLFTYQQDGTPGVEGEVEAQASTGAFKFAQYLGLLLLGRERLWTTLAGLAIITGVWVMLGPYRPITAVFDLSQQRVRVKQPRWFFRSKIDVFPLDNVSEVRVERDRLRRKAANCFGAMLIISQSEGVPLTRDYVHYKTAFPLAKPFRYTYQTTQLLVDRIQGFLKANPS
jgi:hypothetical protein